MESSNFHSALRDFQSHKRDSSAAGSASTPFLGGLGDRFTQLGESLTTSASNVLPFSVRDPQPPSRFAWFETCGISTFNRYLIFIVFIIMSIMCFVKVKCRLSADFSVFCVTSLTLSRCRLRFPCPLSSYHRRTLLCPFPSAAFWCSRALVGCAALSPTFPPSWPLIDWPLAWPTLEAPL